MALESWIPWLSLLIGFVGLCVTIQHGNKSARKEQEKEREEARKEQEARDIDQMKKHEQLVNSISTLASKEYLDQRLKEELCGLEAGVKTQIDELKRDMKEQINEVKQDIKSQQEVTEGMGKDVVRSTEGVSHAHERITSVDKRVDDLRELFLATQKKA